MIMFGPLFPSGSIATMEFCIRGDQFGIQIPHPNRRRFLRSNGASISSSISLNFRFLVIGPSLSNPRPSAVSKWPSLDRISGSSLRSQNNSLWTMFVVALHQIIFLWKSRTLKHPQWLSGVRRWSLDWYRHAHYQHTYRRRALFRWRWWQLIKKWQSLLLSYYRLTCLSSFGGLHGPLFCLRWFTIGATRLNFSCLLKMAVINSPSNLSNVPAHSLAKWPVWPHAKQLSWFAI